MSTPLGALLLASTMMTAQVPKTEKLLTEADAVKIAHDDLQRLPVEVRPTMRYLSMHNLHPKQRSYFRPTLQGHCNKLSRRRTPAPLTIVGDGAVLRLDLEAYGWTHDLWERLPDPYFTQEVDRYEEIPYGIYRGNVLLRTETERKRIKGRFFAEWLDPESANQALRQGLPIPSPILNNLYNWTGSYVPVTHAQWFFNQTAASQDRDPAYHDFLGFNDLKTYERLVGVDTVRSRDFRFELREAVSQSGVATHMIRAIVRDDSLGGGRWATVDFATADEARKGLTTFGRDVDKIGKASEHFGFLPNGLWAVGAFNDAGKLVRTVPAEVASDSQSRSNDRRIHNGVSCFRCHQDGGLQDIDEWARNLFNPPLKLNVIDYRSKEKSIELREQYLSSLQNSLRKDRAAYEDSIKTVTGLTSREDSARYAQMWELYEDARVDAAHAARDLGLTEDEFRTRVLEYVKAYEADPNLTLSPVAGSLLQTGAKARALPIHAYESIIPDLHRATFRPMKSPPPKPKEKQ